MRVSIFSEEIKKRFKGFTEGFTQRNSGEYCFKRFFKKRYEPTLGLRSLIGREALIVDPSLKNRDRKALSDPFIEDIIPKLIIRKEFSERQVNDLLLMSYQKESQTYFQGGDLDERLFSQVEQAVKGIYRQLESMALQSLSRGRISLKGYDIEFLIPKSNRFGVARTWHQAGAAPLEDIERVLNAARKNGHRIYKILMCPEAFGGLRQTQQVRGLFANDRSSKACESMKPRLSQINRLLLEEGIPLIELSTSHVILEKKSQQTPLSIWQEGRVSFLTDTHIGYLAYGPLFEERHPIKGVQYQKIDDYILVSRFGKMDPVQEIACVQARAIPVLKAPQEIYQLNTLNTSW